MIIKSLSRKSGTYACFAQLYDYITRDDGCDQKFNFTQNFIRDDRQSVLREFARNAEFVPQRKNGNYLYHEILSFTRSTQLNQDQQLEIIRNVAIRYVQDRAKGCLAFGGVHTDKDNQLHAHLIISANQLEQSKKHSLKTDVFDQIKKNIEGLVLQQYPEMEQERLINQTREDKIAKSSQREFAYQQRTGKKSDKQLFTEQVQELMQQAHSDKEFRQILDYHGIGYSYKPENITLTNPNTSSKRNTHRIKTLGLQTEYDQMLFRESQAENQSQPVIENDHQATQNNEAESEQENTQDNTIDDETGLNL